MSQQSAIFIYDDLVNLSDTVITASSTASGFAPSNVAVSFRQIPHRFTGCTSEYIQATLAASKAPLSIAIIDHNLTSGATLIRVRSSTTPTFSGGTQYTLSNLTWRSGIIFGTWNAQPSELYPRLELADASNPAGYIQIGRIILSAGFFQPITNWEIGSLKRSYVDRTIINTSMNDVETTILKTKLKTRAAKFPIVTSGERQKWEDFFEFVGKGRNLAAIFDADNNPVRDSIYCKFSKELEDQQMYVNVDEAIVGFKENA